ncbi:hypothetical protein RCL1_007988 [Eukaryota sp. TZLM3-RCL]
MAQRIFREALVRFLEEQKPGHLKPVHVWGQEEVRRTILTEEEQLEMNMKGVYESPVAEQPEVVEDGASEVENQDSEENDGFGELSPLGLLLRNDQ